MFFLYEECRNPAIGSRFFSGGGEVGKRYCRYEQVHDALKARGFVIYAGQGELRKTIFRIANMGAITDDDVTLLIEALRSVFKV